MVLLLNSDRRLFSALVEREAPDLNVFRFDEDPRRVKKRLKRGRGGVGGSVSPLDDGTGCEFMSDDMSSLGPVRQNNRILYCPAAQLYLTKRLTLTYQLSLRAMGLSQDI